jgi:plasmid stability protein
VAYDQLIKLLDRSFALLHNGAILEEQMATLNIKKVPDRLYRKIQARANKEHRSVAQEVIHILSQATEDARSLSILELQGLGKGVWSKVDAGKYVSKEPRGWG